MSITNVEFLQTGDGRRIAYMRRAQTDGGATPGIVFLGGFRSDMTGTKAQYLDEWTRERGLAFLRFDYTGHGQSSGAFENGCIGDWARDAQDAIKTLTAGPQILVGSSMGGWISLLFARAAPERVAGFIGIAAAPDFTEDSMWAGFTAEQREALAATGHIDMPCDYGDDPYIITSKLIEDGRRQLVLRAPLQIDAPVRLLQGDQDADVAPSVALRLLDHVQSPDARLTLVKGADHRMSEARELALLGDTLGEMVSLSAGGQG